MNRRIAFGLSGVLIPPILTVRSGIARQPTASFAPEDFNSKLKSGDTQKVGSFLVVGLR